MSYPSTLADIRVSHPAPAHVPRDRVVDLRFALGFVPNDLIDPYEPFQWLNGPDIPGILFNAPEPDAHYDFANPNGSWMVTHYDDVNRVYSDNDYFSNKGAAEFQRLIGETFPSIPLAIDPPLHGKYRRFLLQWLSPAKVNKMSEWVRSLCVEMIDAVADKGEVDMAWDFGRVFPVRVFMELMGFPAPMFEQFLAWEWDILHTNDVAKMQAALREVLEFLRGFMADKEANPDDRLVSSIVHGTIDGRPLTVEEKTGMVWFLWLGGLDTVAATISQMFRRMALQPELQRRIRENPELIPTAVEEFLRTQPIISSTRIATRDFEWHGVEIKAGDPVQCFVPGANFDPTRFVNPREFDPARPSNRHVTFVAGVHVCLGAPLARQELRILLAEWMRRVPEFRIKEGADTTVFPGLLSIRNLPLVWDAQDRPA